MNMKRKNKLFPKNGLFSPTSAFPQPEDDLPMMADPIPDPAPIGRATANDTETVINLVESALLELTERQYDDAIDIAVNYLDEALGLLRK